MVVHGLGWAVWMMSTFYGYMDGTNWHQMWVFTSKALIAAPLMSIIFTAIAGNAYGTQA